MRTPFFIISAVVVLSFELQAFDFTSNEDFKEAQVVCDNLDFDANKPKCLALFYNLMDARKTDQVLHIAKQACPEFPDVCSAGYNYAKKHAAERKDEIKTIIEKRCDVSPDFCEVLGQIYIEEKQIEKGLEFLQKDFEANGGLSYAIALKEHKSDSTLVHRQAWEDCQTDETKCGFLVRNYPDHPQIEKAIEASARICLNKTYVSQGADDCYILGRHFKNTNQPQKAIQFLSASCPTNDLPCLAILGMSEASTEKKKWAFEKFCKPTEWRSVNLELLSLRKIHCAKRSPAALVPEKLMKESKKLFTLDL